jgi:copper transport protein
VRAVAGGIEVYGPDGERVDRGDTETSEGGKVVAAPVEGDARGTYTVAWRVVSEDGHNLAGSFVYHVGEETGAADISTGDAPQVGALGWLGRWLGFAGSLVAVGTALVATLAPGSETAARRRLWPLVLAAASAGAVGVLAALLEQTAKATGRDLLDAVSLVPDLAAETRSGKLFLARAALLAATALVALVRPLWMRAPFVAGLPVAASMVFASLGSHAWTADAPTLTVGSDIVHQLVAGCWVGGLVALLVAYPVLDDRREVVTRYSDAALTTAGLVLATGVVSAWLELGSVGAVWDSTYGRLVLAKAVGFAVLVGFGWWNRSRLIPALDRLAGRLLQSIRIEVAVAALIVGFTAVLVNQPPPEGTGIGPFTGSARSDGLAVDLTVEPAEVGPNALHLFFFEVDGVTPAAVDAVEVTAAVGEIPPRRLDVTPVTPEHATISGASLTQAGTWTIEVTAVRAGQPITVPFEVPIR